ncbi:NAD(P)H-dependent oxidoreductase [Okibacterium endophyticum]
MKALALICTLTPSPGASSSELIAQQFMGELTRHGVTGDLIRVVDHNIAPGVQTDMGDGDEWPAIRQRILDADILMISTPTWLGNMSSVAQRVLERLDAELSETDAMGRPILFDKVAAVAVVGNEDGAHAITASLYQGLSDLGFTVPSQAVAYWNGEAMHGTDYKDLPSIPDPVVAAMRTAAANTSHLAGLLTASPYPVLEG